MYAQSAIMPAPQPSPHSGFNIPLQPQTCDVPRRASIFLEGDDAEFVYEVLAGVVCCYYLLADGRRQVLSFAFPGDLLGLVQGEAHRYSAEALARTRVHSISRSALLKSAAERPELGQKLLRFATSRLAMMQDHSVMLGRMSALEKVASFLLSLADKTGLRDASTVVLDLPMTRVDIADYLGLTLETVSRTLSKLKVAGAIDLSQPHKVVVLDVSQLESLANGPPV